MLVLSNQYLRKAAAGWRKGGSSLENWKKSYHSIYYVLDPIKVGGGDAPQDGYTTILTLFLQGWIIIMLSAVTHKPKASVTSHNWGLIFADAIVHCETRCSDEQLSCRWWLRDPGSTISAFTSSHMIRGRKNIISHWHFPASPEIGIHHIHPIILVRTSHLTPT